MKSKDITLNQLLTEERFRKITKSELIKVIDYYLSHEDYEKLSGNFADGKAENLIKLWNIIVSTPEEKPEPVEFKEGEMVEYPLYDCNNRKKINRWKQCRFTGGYSESGEPIVETDNGILLVDKIRKLDPDRELNEIAFGIMCENSRVEINKDSYCYTEPIVKSMLLEMGKRVKNKIG